MKKALDIPADHLYSIIERYYEEQVRSNGINES
jgi:hypothetical protein